MRRRRGAGLAGEIRAGRGNRHAAGRDERLRHRMRRKPHADAVQPRRRFHRNSVRLIHDHRQRARPVGLRQPARAFRHFAGDHLGKLIERRNVHDQRIVARPSLRREDALYRFPVQRVAAQTVYRFRRKPDHLSGANQRARFLQCPRVRLYHSCVHAFSISFVCSARMSLSISSSRSPFIMSLIL